MLDDFFHPTRNCCGLIPTGRYGNCDTLIDHTLKHCPQIDPSSKIHVIKTRAHAHTYMHGYTPGWHSHQCTHIGACQRVLEEGVGGATGRGKGGREGVLGGVARCREHFVRFTFCRTSGSFFRQKLLHFLWL